MKNLMQLESYLEEVSVPNRLGLLSGVAFAVFMGVILLAMSFLGGLGAAASLKAVAVGGAISGLLFGAFFGGALKKQLRKTARSIYLGEGRYKTEQPNGVYTHRVPASLKKSARVSAGGVLYLGPGSAAFVPHAINLPSHRVVLEITEISSTSVSLAQQELTRAQRLLMAAVPPSIRINSSTGIADFVIPRAADLLSKIRLVIASAEYGASGEAT